MKHPLVNRTSPKGTPFIGTCAACGKSGITFQMLPSDECDNVRGMTQEQAILEAVQHETQAQPAAVASGRTDAPQA